MQSAIYFKILGVIRIQIRFNDWYQILIDYHDLTTETITTADVLVTILHTCKQDKKILANNTQVKID